MENFLPLAVTLINPIIELFLSRSPLNALLIFLRYARPLNSYYPTRHPLGQTSCTFSFPNVVVIADQHLREIVCYDPGGIAMITTAALSAALVFGSDIFWR